MEKAYYSQIVAANMTQVAIDDRLIGKARTVTNLRTDREILEEALRGYIGLVRQLG
jgi:Arc/MetJ family transcription regulator